MEQLGSLVLKLPKRHRQALQWFTDHAGEILSWPEPLANPEGEILLASKAKGIYKPRWSRYALSVRQSLHSPYPDLEPMLRSNGTWLLAYFQENQDPSARDDEYTNRALLNCRRDSVPVGVLRQTKARPDPRYQVLGVALVAGWDGGYFFLEGFAPEGFAQDPGPTGEIEFLIERRARAEDSANSFQPEDAIDGRERIMAHILRRRGQPEFRAKLLAAYENRCAISGCNVVEALEAAHIVPYSGLEANHISNGLLLRADIHTLFDLGLITIDPVSWTILMVPSLRKTSYSRFAGRTVHLPRDTSACPSEEALRLHRAWSGL